MSDGMAVDWFGPGVDACGALLRKRSCSIDGNDPPEDSPSVGGGVVGSLLSFHLLEESADKVVRLVVIPSAIGALCRMVGLLEIGVQVGMLMVLLCNRALGLFNR